MPAFFQTARQRITQTIVILLFSATIIGCGSGGSDPNGNSNPPPGKTAEATIESLNINAIALKSASSEGNFADVSITIEASGKPGAENQFIRLEILDDQSNELTRSEKYFLVDLPEGQTTTEFTLSVPFLASSLSGKQDYTLRAEMQNQETDEIEVLVLFEEASFTLGFPAGVTPLSDVSAIELTIIPGSYSTMVSGARRVHYFSAQVHDQNGNSISGLASDTQKYFSAIEDGVYDEESNVIVDSRENAISVYLIIDASSSISQAGAITELRSAASQTVLSLASFSDFNYREFSGDVRKLNSLRELNFETSNSATALYRSVDSALADIALSGRTEDTVIITFTDGRDLASRNHYPDLESHEAVRDYVAGKIENLRTQREQNQGSTLTTHFIGLGSNIDEGALSTLASAGGGQYFFAYDKDNLENVFSALANLIKSTYRLEYSSQQLPDDTHLQLQVEINGLIDVETVKGRD